ncbi:hypothetical protein [Candidatus Nitrosotenuis cloacae]|uniref:hypothetical protein n=1 Tax=Candidatus Nitrosotenuis cloacae TaxID=1603555 RepID=UPI00227EE601|nr:hypothetical protein [Candidatus Nitrosotenuis cloacae]
MGLGRMSVAVFVIPIVFSFVYGGSVLSLAMNNSDGTPVFTASPSSKSIAIIDLSGEYAVSDAVSARISVSDQAFSCGDLYVTIYEISGSERKAVTQGAFFDQCYEQSGTLPIGETFSERIGTAGQYQIEVQLFDKSGDKFVTASERFTVR